jgi:hypothetical protein
MTEEQKTPWWKKAWLWLVAIAGASFALLLASRRTRERVLLDTPARPELEDVELPEVGESPADDYEAQKQPVANGHDPAERAALIARLNEKDS